MKTHLAAAIALCACAAWAQRPGFPNRDAGLDVLPGFQSPPPGYGEVGFYWWLGDPLTRERLTWQLDRMKGMHIAGLQVNYAHSDQGGQSWGLTYRSEPPLFSAPWWDLFGWFLRSASARGMAVSLSDYTLGAGQGWHVDEILAEAPELRGSQLVSAQARCSGTCQWQAPANPLAMVACSQGRCLDLRSSLDGRALNWQTPAGDWTVTAVGFETQAYSLDPMHPESGSRYVAKFFQRFEDRNPGEAGKGLNFFFSDELDFGVKGWLWDSGFREQFRRRKGYDVVPELPALFADIGPRTAKVRLDYSDVMVALEEEHFFRPLFEWHQSRGMIFGCDHGGRGRDVTEFGDYFRTQRWMNGPGNDQPGLASDVIKNKVASSIAHLYERPRTWLEGYYGSGWGTSTAQLADATFRNFAMGHNLLTLHGMYYSTHGGWWEWAPPDNHLKMPYWPHMKEFLGMTERLSYLLSQGVHRADVAIVYPVAAMEAGLDGKQSVDAAFQLGSELYGKGIDFDFIDFESLARATIEDRELRVSGERYRILVLPSMRAVRWSTLEKAVAFQRAGGHVVMLGAAPEASERMGAGDPQLALLARELAGAAHRALASMADPDFSCKDLGKPPYILHRVIGPRDVYFVYGVPRNTECRFRATGALELWNPWTGATQALPAMAQTASATTVRMPSGEDEAQILVFSPGTARISAEAPAESQAATVDGAWEFEVMPSLDNRFGDFRLPASNSMIGPEIRRFEYRDEDAPGDQWSTTTYGYGPRFQGYTFSWRTGIEDDPGHQGYHGLKGLVSDDFIALGARKQKHTTIDYEPEPGVSSYELRTSVYAGSATSARVVAGELMPASIILNGERLAGSTATVRLNAGQNPLVLDYASAGRGHFLLIEASALKGWKQTAPLAMTWYGMPGVLPFDVRPNDPRPAGLYRFTAPPGLRSMTVHTSGKLQAWAGEIPMKVERLRPGVYRVSPTAVLQKASTVRLRIEQRRGDYAGAAIPEPITLDIVPGRIEAGDWSRTAGLSSYSGGAWYRKTVTLHAAQASGQLALDLGKVVSSAEVRVNGKAAGIRVAPPFRFEIGPLVKSGANRIEILIYNTLANHYETIPTRYRGSAEAGLLGPVTLR